MMGDPLKAQVTAIWCEILRTPTVGANDSFLLHANSSLAAMRMLARVARVTGATVPLHVFLRNPTIAGLVEEVGQRAGQTTPAPVAATTTQLAAPVSYAQQGRLVLMEQRLADGMPDRPRNMIETFQLHGALELDRFAEAVKALLVRRPELRTRFARQDGDWWQYADQGVPSTSEFLFIHEATECSDGSYERWHAEFARTNLPFAEPRRIRFDVWPEDFEENRLTVVVDHLVADDWSVALILADLAEAYVRPQRLLVPTSSSTYFAFSAAQRTAIASGEADEALDRLAKVLSRVSPTGYCDTPLSIALDNYPVGATIGRSLVVQRGTIELNRRVSGVPMTDVALVTVTLGIAAGLAAKLDHVPVVGYVANREQPDLAATVGWLANTVTVPIAVGRDLSVREALHAGWTAWLTILGLSWVPYQLMRQRLAPEELGPAAVRPSFAVTYGAEKESRLALGGLQVERKEDPYEPAPGGPGGRGRILLDVTETAEGLYMELLSEADRFPVEFIDRLEGFLRLLLSEFSEDVAAMSLEELSTYQAS